MEVKSSSQSVEKSIKLSSRTPFKSSRKVFMSFVEFKPNGPDVSKVFSKECYEKWLKTRITQNLKSPEQSFQRVLYSHIRGVDRRRPFPPIVEKALLQLLRQKDENPLQKIFASGKRQNVGSRGFHKVGFHEQAQINEAKEKALVPVARKHEDTQLFRLNVPYKLGVTPFDLIWHTLEYWMPKQERNEIFGAALARGVDVRAPALRFFLQDAPSHTDLRYNFDFLLPPASECSFSPDIKIGHFVTNSSLVCIEEDEATIEFFHGSSLNKHMYQMVGSLVCCLYAKIKSLPEFKKNGNIIWRRSTFKKRDGKTGVFLLQAAENKTTSRVHFMFQDVSYQYQDILVRPHFL